MIIIEKEANEFASLNNSYQLQLSYLINLNYQTFLFLTEAHLFEA